MESKIKVKDYSRNLVEYGAWLVHVTNGKSLHTVFIRVEDNGNLLAEISSKRPLKPNSDTYTSIIANAVCSLEKDHEIEMDSTEHYKILVDLNNW